MKKLIAHIIMHNCREDFCRLVESLRGVIDAWVVVDDHSDDWGADPFIQIGSYLDIRGWSAQNLSFGLRKLFDENLGALNFEAQRNFCLEIAEKRFGTGPDTFHSYWDTDEVLTKKGRRALKGWKNSDAPYKLVALPVRNLRADGSRIEDETKIKIWRSDLGIRWEGVIHETLAIGGLVDQHKDAQFVDALIEHDGYDTPEKQRAKAQRNLEVALAEMRGYGISQENLRKRDIDFEKVFAAHSEARYCIYNVGQSWSTIAEHTLAHAAFTVVEETRDPSKEPTSYDALCYYYHARMLYDQILGLFEEFQPGAVASDLCAEVVLLCDAGNELFSTDARFLRLKGDTLFETSKLVHDDDAGALRCDAVTAYRAAYKIGNPGRILVYDIADFFMGPCIGIANCFMADESYIAAAAHYRKALKHAEEYNAAPDLKENLKEGILASLFNAGRFKEVLQDYKAFRIGFDTHSLAICFIECKKYKKGVNAILAHYQERLEESSVDVELIEEIINAYQRYADSEWEAGRSWEAAKAEKMVTQWTQALAEELDRLAAKEAGNAPLDSW